MLNFNDILVAYPKRLQVFKENILKEYLQHKILDIIFSTGYAKKLIFIGGTSIRIIHNSTRFSEDLDFDNFDLTKDEFQQICEIIKQQLDLDGYITEIKVTSQLAFHCYIKFPGILFQENLSGYKEERILIRLDSQAQGYHYLPEKYLLEKFGLFRYINVAPINTLLAQKICALFGRKQKKGRDFFDVVYLMSITKPDYNFLNHFLKIESKEQLIFRLKDEIKDLNFKLLAKDVESFLFDSSQKNRVLYFKDWLAALT